MRTGVWMWAVAAVAVGWPEEGRVGSYGTWTLSRPGFTIARAIRVGEMSDPAREAEVVRAQEARAAQATAPQVKALEAWFSRVRAARGRGVGWLDALDVGRATPADGDYRARLPGPVAAVTAVAPPDVVAPEVDDFALWLHMRADAAPVAVARALAGVALGACDIGEAKLVQAPRPLAQRLAWAVDGDGEADQPWIVASLLFETCGRLRELDAVASDEEATAGVRALARLLRQALSESRIGHADWELLARAGADVGPTKVWVWVLMLGPASEQAARRAELERRVALDAEARARFLGPWVLGTPP